MKIKSIKKVEPRTVYAVQTSTGTFIADGLAHHNCRHCNIWRDKDDMLQAYKKSLALKCGDDTVAELKRLSKLPEAYKRPSKAELLQIIADAKQEVEYILAHKENYQR